MSDVDGGAPAPADTAPIADHAVTPPAPISTEPIPAEPKAPESKDDMPKEPVSTRDALKKAAEKVEKDAKETDKPKPVDSKPADKADAKPAEQKPEDKAAPQRDPTGKSASSEPKPVDPPKPKYEAPARFSDDAKQAWATAPEPVQREIDRAVRELTQGHEKYKSSADAYEAVRKWDDMAKSGGTTLDAALKSYTETEQLLRRDPIKGLESICQNLGLSMKDVAEHYLSRTPEQQQTQRDTEVNGLMQQVAALTQEIQAMRGQTQAQSVQATIDAFKADPKYSRFEELRPDIGMLLQIGKANNLPEAYAMAERLNPAPAAQASTPAASSAPVIDLQAQAAKGSKSINGAPSPGSNPDQRTPSSSIKESLRKAMAKAG